MSVKMPAYFMLCQNHACPNAADCLRQLSYDGRAAEAVSISVLNPSRYPNEGEACPHFRLNETVRMAWGIKNLFSKLPHDAAKSIKAQMLQHFGRTRFYRFYREEIPVTPEEQARIQEIFIANGVTSEPDYTRFSDEIDW